MECSQCGDNATTETHLSVASMAVRGGDNATVCFDADEGVLFIHEELNT